MIAETIYNGEVLRGECYYNERQWMEHVERHAKKILKRYIKRKCRKLIFELKNFLLAGGFLTLLLTVTMIVSLLTI